MKIGLFSFVETIDSLTALAATAREQGFDSLWVPQTFGLDSPAWTPRILFVGRALSLVLGAGFFILPIATFVVGLK